MDYLKADKILNVISKDSTSNITWIAHKYGYKSISEEIQFLVNAGYITLDEILGTEVKITPASMQFITNGVYIQLNNDKELERQNKKISIELSSKQIKEIEISKKFSKIAIIVSILSLIAAVFSMFI